MATILIIGNGSRSRRCDATCHNATGSDCTCICGGRYHGRGVEAPALLSGDALGADWRERLGIDAAAVPMAVQQALPLEGVETLPRARKPRQRRRERAHEGEQAALL